jgi:glycosyltransferase involved in cell wall biosynthesis
MKLSVVIPCYRSEDTLPDTVEGVIQELARDYDLEIVLVHDGSGPATWKTIESLIARHRGIVGIDLRRNFGEFNAVMEGIRVSSGDAVVVIDDDLQHPPSEIRKLVETWSTGDYDVVYGRYSEKKHSWIRNLGSAWNGFMARILLKKPFWLYLSSFKLIDGQFARELAQHRMPFVYPDGLILWSTSRLGQVEVEHRERAQGISNYNWVRLVRVNLNVITGYSFYPLRLSTLGGTGSALLGWFGAIWVMIEKWMDPGLPVGYASAAVAFLFVSGIVLMMIGLLGEYVGRIAMAVNQRPQVSVRKVARSKQT